MTGLALPPCRVIGCRGFISKAKEISVKFESLSNFAGGSAQKFCSTGHRDAARRWTMRAVETGLPIGRLPKGQPAQRVGCRTGIPAARKPYLPVVRIECNCDAPIRARSQDGRACPGQLGEGRPQNRSIPADCVDGCFPDCYPRLPRQDKPFVTRRDVALDRSRYPKPLSNGRA